MQLYEFNHLLKMNCQFEKTLIHGQLIFLLYNSIKVSVKIRLTV